MDYSDLRALVVREKLPFDLHRDAGGKLSRKNKFDKVSVTVAQTIDDHWLLLAKTNIPLEKDEQIPEPDLNDPNLTSALNSNQLVPVQVDAENYNKHNEFCNSVLWPLLHLQPNSAHFEDDYWKGYVAINQTFAQRAIEILKTTKFDVVWIHDYQLMLTAVPIRQAIVEEQITCKLGFFHHTTFPPWDVMKPFPWSDDLLQGVLANDVLGFQTLTHCQNFLNCCHRCLGCRVDDEKLLVEHGGRIVTIKPLTVGIPFEHLAKLAEPSVSLNYTQKIITSFEKTSQGVDQKLTSLDSLFKNHPQHIEDVILLFVIARKCNDQQEKIDKFNADFSTSNWYPVHCTYGHKTRSEIAALLKRTNVCLVAPINGEISVIAKEYVACQTTAETPGVLLLSWLSGNAETMPEAIISNPNGLNHFVQMLHRALVMSDSEKMIRMNYLRKREELNDCHQWKKTFLETLSNHTNTGMPQITLNYFDQHLNRFLEPRKEVALLLDYDGTLAPIMPHPDLCIIPNETKTILERLSKTPGCYLAIISGRGLKNVMEMVGIEGITYAGNHGLDILFPDGSSFSYPIPEGICERVHRLDDLLQKSLCDDDAWVENKGTSLTFHYNDRPLDLRKAIEAKAKAIIEEAEFKSEHAHLAVEAKPIVQWNKGRAAVYILEKIYGTNWANTINVIYSGDDVTDEDAISILKGMAATIRVTSLTMTKTSADYRVPNSWSILTLLKWVEHYLSRK